jgi:hypothetical protein
MNETRHSSPEKLSPSKFSGKLIEKENRASEDRSFRLKQLEMHERQDSEQPLNEDRPSSAGTFRFNPEHITNEQEDDLENQPRAKLRLN